MADSRTTADLFDSPASGKIKAWGAGVEYEVNDIFAHNGKMYLVNIPHVSTGSPENDIANLSPFDPGSIAWTVNNW